MTLRKIAVVSAGLGSPSSTRLLADRLAAATEERLVTAGEQVEIEVVELRDHAVEIANNLVTGFPGTQLRSAVDAVTTADAVIAVTPVFTASYSGLFKSFFDVLDNTALSDTPVLLAATGGTERHSLVLEHALRPMFAYLRAATAPTAVYAASADWGNDTELRTRIDRAATDLVALLAARPARNGAVEQLESAPFAELLGGIG